MPCAKLKVPLTHSLERLLLSAGRVSKSMASIQQVEANNYVGLEAADAA
jgi:hypothetical protein